MQVHQPFDLFLGIAMLVLGIPGLGRDIYRALTHRLPGTYQEWRMLVLDIWFATSGPSHCSQAFDMPHHPSHRTAALDTFAVLFLAIAGVIGTVALIAERRRKRAEQSKAEVWHDSTR